MNDVFVIRILQQSWGTEGADALEDFIVIFRRAENVVTSVQGPRYLGQRKHNLRLTRKVRDDVGFALSITLRCVRLESQTRP